MIKKSYFWKEKNLGLVWSQRVKVGVVALGFLVVRK